MSRRIGFAAFADHSGRKELGYMDSRTYILKWREGLSPEIRWFLRGIREDGSFYGEFQCVWQSPKQIDGKSVDGAGKSIEGRMSTSDNSRFRELAAGIGTPGAKSIDGWTGLLAEGSIDCPIMRFYYVPGDVRESSDASRFLAAIELLAGYLRPYYSEMK